MSDEYDEYDLSEFSEEQLAQMEAALGASQGGPTITVEVEDAADTDMKGAATDGPTRGAENAPTHEDAANKSPFERYRWKRNAFSVTDLTAPVWCEVQFDYGLRQKRNRKLDDRPKSFVTSAGKEIVVEQAVAARNDKTLKRGQTVHKKLEREIRPEAVLVDITTDEERWAVRLIDMLACLQDLMSLRGCAREMPVFGIVHDHLVTGVIDEILRKPARVSVPNSSTEPSPARPKRTTESTHATPNSKRNKKRTPSPNQSQLDSYFRSPTKVDIIGVSLSNATSSYNIPSTDVFSGTHADAGPPTIDIPEVSLAERSPPRTPPSSHGTNSHTPVPANSSPKCTLHLVDTKTRRSGSLPPDEDTLSSRLQLNLYRRLLSALLSTSGFDFSGLYHRLGLDSAKLFSERFRAQAGLDGAAGCLNDLTQQWEAGVRVLDIDGIDPELQLIYRHAKSKDTSNKWRGKQKAPTDAGQEERDIARALEASLLDISGVKAQEADVLSTSEESLEALDMVADDDPALAWAIQQSLLDSSKGSTESPIGSTSDGPSAIPDGTKAVPTASHATTPPRPESDIIGTKTFVADDALLDAHLTDVLKWWHGVRPPRGVEVNLARRCFTCEYRDGCEWREMKAEEANERLRARRKQHGR